MKTNHTLTDATNRYRVAFTLAEVLVSLAVTSLLMVAVASSMGSLGRVFLNLATHYDLQFYDRRAESMFTRDIREARRVVSYDGFTLALTDDANRDLSYTWDAASLTVNRSHGGINTIMLTGCTNFTVNFYARPVTNAPGLFGELITCNPTNAGVLEACWTCLRNTNSVMRQVAETVTSGKIEIRTH